MSRQIETELLACCAHDGLGAVVYSPPAQWQDDLDAVNIPFTAEDAVFVSGRLPSPGHASTPGYSDPAYPLTGRAPRCA